MQENKNANEDQRVKTLFQDLVMEEEQFEEEDEVHGMEDKGSAPFLTKAAYEKSLFKGPAHNFVVPAEQQAYKQKQPTIDPIILKVPAIEVRGLEGSPSLGFKSEIQKPRIHMPLIGPVKNESFKKSILEDPELKASPSSNDYANLQIDEPVVIPSPVIKKGEVNFPSSYASPSVHETIPHSCPLGTEASHSVAGERPPPSIPLPRRVLHT